MSFFDPIVGGLEAAIDARNRNQTVITSNLANADTPGYRAKELDFERSLAAVIEAKTGPGAAELAQTTSGHLGVDGVNDNRVGRVIETAYDANAVGLDGNTVNRDSEGTKMAENQILYRASTRAIARNFALVRYAISEGGR